jgi:hypothetical protein
VSILGFLEELAARFVFTVAHRYWLRETAERLMTTAKNSSAAKSCTNPNHAGDENSAASKCPVGVEMLN